MRSLRHLVVAASLATVTSGIAAQAQDTQQHPGRGAMMEQMVMKGITLSDAQKAQVDSIHNAYRSQFQALGQPGPDTRQQRRDLMMKQSGDVRSVLTPDQQTIYDKNIADMREHMQHRGGGGGEGPPPQ
jgi:Spy/CpxP family protein refolding chaperone